MQRIQNFWADDPGRQSLIAFVAGFLVVGAVAAAIFTAPTFSGFACAVQVCRDEIETERSSNAVRGRYVAEREAAEQAELIGASAAERDLPNLLAGGTHDEGYALAYGNAWNDAVNQFARRQPRQMLADQDGTQWIELLR